MDITPSLIYWISILDNIETLCASIAIISLGAVFVGLLFMFLETELAIEYRSVKKMVKFAMPIFLIFGLLTIFLPSSKTVAAMYIIPRIANHEKIQDFGNSLYDLAVEWMKELKPRKCQ